MRVIVGFYTSAQFRGQQPEIVARYPEARGFLEYRDPALEGGHVTTQLVRANFGRAQFDLFARALSLQIKGRCAVVSAFANGTSGRNFLKWLLAQPESKAILVAPEARV